jgi:hypothetical protein
MDAMVDIEKLLSSARNLELKGEMLSKVRYREGAGARVINPAKQLFMMLNKPHRFSDAKSVQLHRCGGAIRMTR